MKKILLILLIMLALTAISACNFSNSEDKNPSDNNGGASIEDDATFKVGEKVYIVAADGLDISGVGIEKLVAGAIGDSCVSYITDDKPQEESEITIGSCNRDISRTGYEKLSAVSRENDSFVRYGIYSSGDSVAIVFDLVPGLEKQIISCATQLFDQLYVEENSDICINADEFKFSVVEISTLQEMKNSDSWTIFESLVGTEAKDSLKKMHSDLYTEEIIDFIASLYDSNYGGFYSSSTAKDQLGFENDGVYQYYLPDVESSLMAISFIEKSGMICGYSGIKEALPLWMNDQIDRFLSANKDDVQDDLTESVIDQLNASCDPESGLWCEKIDINSPEEIIELVEIYAIYERFNAAIPYANEAVNSLVSALIKADDTSDIGIYYAWEAICSITANLEVHSADDLTQARGTLSESCAELIGVTEAYIRGQLSNSIGDGEGSILSAVILSTEINECIFSAFGSPEITLYTRADLDRFVSLISENRVLYTYTPSDKFYQSGAVNYRIYSFKNSYGTDEPMIYIYNHTEFIGEKLQRAIISHIVASDDGVNAGLSLDRLDFYHSVIFEQKFTYHYASSESGLVEGAINYKITPYSSKAAVLKIYNSYLITDEDDMREILTYLITSEEGAKANLSLLDIDYYVVEWKAHNIMYKNPSVIPFMSQSEVKERAKHVDLNTDDSYASIYSTIVSMYG